MNKTEYINPNFFILKDLKKNGIIDGKSKDNNLKETYKNKASEDFITKNVEIKPSLNYNRYNLYYKNKNLDRDFFKPVYDYESSGRDKIYFDNGLLKTGLTYSTPSLERTTSRY